MNTSPHNQTSDAPRVRRRLINRNLIAVAHDALMAAASFVLAAYIRLGDAEWSFAQHFLLTGTVVLTLTCICVFIYMRLYRGLWRYASIQDMIVITKAVSLSILIFGVVMFAINRMEGFPRSVLFINWLLLIFMLAAPRFVYRALKDRTLRWTKAQGSRIPVLVIGAGHDAEQFIRNTTYDDSVAPYYVVGVVDEDPAQKGRTIHRIPIYGGTDILHIIIRKLERKGIRPQKMILADHRIAGPRVRQLLEMADTFGIPLARLPRLNDFQSTVSDKVEVRPIAVEDLLGRPQNVLDRESMQRFVQGRKVLVTGAGGTIGGELTRQIASYNPSELILLEMSEFNLYQIEREIRATCPELKLTVILSDVRDARHIDTVFRTHLPNLVFHAAAIKHVPIAESNIEEAILTNVFGTRHVADACQKHGADVMVMISTDKAVNPSNVMGATKRLAENYCQALGDMHHRKAGHTKYITVRFGNVLGSTGSVVPLFTEQLAKGGPLTVTHPDMTRYFMTVREAVELVLQAATLGAALEDRQECIFVLDMGQPVRILDLALQMIRLAGLKPYEDIKITYSGLRPGEKLYEELFHFSENAVRTTHESIFLASPRFTDLATLRKSLEVLYNACSERKSHEAVTLLKKLVPEFQTELKAA